MATRTVDSKVRALLDLLDKRQSKSNRLADDLAFANSEQQPNEPPNGQRRDARIKVVKAVFPVLPAMADAALASCPSAAKQIIAFREAFVAAINDPYCQGALSDARTALEIAAYESLRGENLPATAALERARSNQNPAPPKYGRPPNKEVAARREKVKRLHNQGYTPDEIHSKLNLRIDTVNKDIQRG